MLQDTNRRMKDSGIPWVGMIPKDWTIEPIGRNILEVDNPNVGGVETNALQFKAGTIISKSKGDSKYHPETLEAYNIVDKGVIMLNGLNLSFDLISQRVGLVQERGVITSAYLAIKPNNNIDSEYLTYLFKGYDSRKALHSMGKGLRQTLAYKELKQYSVVYPPLPTQQRIADFLDRKCAEIDELAALQEKMIEELKRYKQSLITETVTKGLDPNAPMKDSGVEWIGEIPEEWVVGRIKYVATLFGRIGFRGYSSDDLNKDGIGAITLSPSNMLAMAMDYSHLTYLSWEKYEESPEIMIQNGDLLMVKTGSSYGKVSYVDNLPQEATINPQILRIVPNINSKYLGYQLQTSSFVFQIECGVVGGTIPTISQEKINNIFVVVPPLSEQQQIADYLDRKCAEIDELIAIKQQKIEALKEYKKSVIFEYVTGKKEI